MKSNIIYFIFGFSILIMVFIILFLYKRIKVYKKSTNNEKQNKYIERIIMDIKAENEVILQKIKKLEFEVERLKEENNTYKKEQKNNSFKPILNYNIFKEKNSNIIELHKKGKSNEEIAKLLNKSIREIEMIIKLIK